MYTIQTYMDLYNMYIYTCTYSTNTLTEIYILLHYPKMHACIHCTYVHECTQYKYIRTRAVKQHIFTLITLFYTQNTLERTHPHKHASVRVGEKLTCLANSFVYLPSVRMGHLRARLGAAFAVEKARECILRAKRPDC